MVSSEQRAMIEYSCFHFDERNLPVCRGIANWNNIPGHPHNWASFFTPISAFRPRDRDSTINGRFVTILPIPMGSRMACYISSENEEGDNIPRGVLSEM